MNSYRGGRLCLRKGSAMVELVLGMFPLVLMFGVLLWISQFAWQLPSHQCEVRNQAWSQRYSEQRPESKVFDFESRIAIEVSEQTRVTGIGPAFNLFPDISARNNVLASSWDYRQLKMERPPHWNLAKELAVKSQPEKLKGLAGVLPPNLGAFTNAIRQGAIAEGNVVRSTKMVLDQLAGYLPGIQSRNSEREEDSRREALRAKEEFEANRPPLVAEVDAARENLDKHDRLIEQRGMELEAERKKLAEAKEDEKKKIQERIDQLNDEILPRLREERIQLVDQVEEAERKLKDFDSLEPPPID